MRRYAAFFLLLTGCAGTQTTTSRPRGEPPKIVVAIVVDQLAAWVALERMPTLPETGGFARLRREGTYFVNAEMPHAVTDTAPGHAVLFTGEPPRTSGIFANEVVGEDGERVSILFDATTRIVGPDGATERPGSSIVAMRVPTVADTVRAHAPGRRVVALSLKDRGAIFGGGRTPDATIYFEPALDAFVTSTAFATTMPAWAVPHARTEGLVALRAAPWTPLDAAWLDAHATSADDAHGEGDVVGLGRAFPHDIAGARVPAKAMRASPYGDLALLALATAAIDDAVAAERELFLAVSFSSNDYVGHVFGPESREAWDELRRLDAVLATLFATLDARVGADGYAIVLSADHGVVPTPETMSGGRWCTGEDAFARPCSAGVRIDPDALARTLEAAADAALGAGAYVLGVGDPYVVLTPEARALEGDRRALLTRTLEAALGAYPGVAAFYASETDPCPISGPYGDAVCAGIVVGAGAYYVLPAQGAFFDSTYVPGEGTSHGTPYPYDRRVPLFVRAPGVAAGRRVEEVVPASRYRDALCAVMALPREGACAF